MTTDGATTAPGGHGAELRSLRHWGGFLFSGGTAFLVDAGTTAIFVHFVGLDRFVARIIGIGVAMVAAWLLHRRVTFNVSAPRSLAEFLRFSAVALTANALNFAIYSLLLIAFPTIHYLIAIVIATGVATIFSYVGFRLGVFRRA
jgi:putative flippase GtrA